MLKKLLPIFLVTSALSLAADDDSLVSETVSQESVDVWVWRIGKEGSQLALEMRNRANNPVRVRGKILAIDSATGNPVRQCEYDVRIPVRSFVSKKTKCSLSGANALAATIDELIQEAP